MWGINAASLYHKGVTALAARYYLRSAASLGPRTRVWGRPWINNQGRLVVGDRVRLHSTVAPLQIDVGPDGELTIGDRVFINYGCSIGATLNIKIGARTLFGPHVIVMDNDFHTLDPDKREETPPSKPIVIGENVWLCARAIVLRGVTIGEGSVIGAGSVVARDIPPRVLAAGSPIKIIREL